MSKHALILSMQKGMKKMNDGWIVVVRNYDNEIIAVCEANDMEEQTKRLLKKTYPQSTIMHSSDPMMPGETYGKKKQHDFD